MLGLFLTFLPISQRKMTRFSFRKKLLEGKHVLFKAIKLANLLGVFTVFASYQSEAGVPVILW